MIAAKILLTVATLGYSAIPCIADLNASHATNPNWVGHARFHVVWQVASYALLALVGLGLIWGPGEQSAGRLWIAASMAAAAYAGFFVAVATRSLYGGTNYDPNGVLPIRLPVIGDRMSFEVNITLFCMTTVCLVAGALCLPA